MKIKVCVQQKVEKEIDVEFPFYFHMYHDFDHHYSDSYMCIMEDLTMHDISIDCEGRYAYEIDKTDTSWFASDNIDVITKEEFTDNLNEFKRRMIP